MKRLYCTIALAGVCGLQAQNPLEYLTVEASLAWESEYVFRGFQVAEHSFQPSVEIGVPLGGGDIYGGVWTNQPITEEDGNSQFENEVDFFAGYAIDITEVISLDVGITYYWYPEVDGDDSETEEFFFGIGADVLLEPALYVYYDLTREAWTVMLSIRYRIDFEELFNLPGMGINLSAYTGYVTLDGDDPGIFAKDDHLYWGGQADLAYEFLKGVTAAAGVRYAGNEQDWRENDNSHLWVGASISYAY